MGTDIHLVIEAKRNNKWCFVASDVCSYSSDNKFTYYECSINPQIISLLSSRNYVFFGIISGVRGSLNPIQITRGLPNDMSDRCREYHSHSDHNEGYVTLTELLNYDWDQIVPGTGFKVSYYISDIYNSILALKDLNEEEIRLVFHFDS